MLYSINKTLILEGLVDIMTGEPEHENMYNRHENSDAMRMVHESPSINHDSSHAAAMQQGHHLDGHRPTYQGVPDIKQNFLNKFNTIASKLR